MQIIILLYNYAQYNIDIFLIKTSEEWYKGENMEVTGDIAASSLKSRL